MIPSPPRPQREPIFNLPGLVLAIILGLVGLHALRVLALPEWESFRLLMEGAVVPARWSVAYGGMTADQVVAGIEGRTDELSALQVELARYVLQEPGGKPWTGITYALLHGSWAHVLMNSVWFAAFGTPVLRRCGAVRFLALLAVTAFGGALAHVLVHPDQALPMIGASASVSGLMACAAWFMFAPPTWLLEGRLAEPHERPRERLVGLVQNRRILIFLGVWFGTNYISALLAQPLGITDASIAWEAHMGGFLAGLALFPLLDPLKPRRAPAPMRRARDPVDHP